jgi:hypothetical protein
MTNFSALSAPINFLTVNAYAVPSQSPSLQLQLSQGSFCAMTAVSLGPSIGTLAGSYSGLGGVITLTDSSSLSIYVNESNVGSAFTCLTQGPATAQLSINGPVLFKRFLTSNVILDGEWWPMVVANGSGVSLVWQGVPLFTWPQIGVTPVLMYSGPGSFYSPTNSLPPPISVDGAYLYDPLGLVSISTSTNGTTRLSSASNVLLTNSTGQGGFGVNLAAVSAILGPSLTIDSQEYLFPPITGNATLCGLKTDSVNPGVLPLSTGSYEALLLPTGCLPTAFAFNPPSGTPLSTVYFYPGNAANYTFWLLGTPSGSISTGQYTYVDTPPAPIFTMTIPFYGGSGQYYLSLYKFTPYVGLITFGNGQGALFSPVAVNVQFETPSNQYLEYLSPQYVDGIWTEPLYIPGPRRGDRDI